MLNVLLVAHEGVGAEVLRQTVRGGHHVMGVLTSAEPSNPVWRVAEKLGLPVWPEELLVTDPKFPDRIRNAGVDVLLNVHSLVLIPDAVLIAPRIGSFNLHPGPLPEYAGLNAPSWAIYHGESTHGVTLHWMNGEIDAGPTAYEASFPLEPGDTGLTLSLKCARAGIPLIAELLASASRSPSLIPRVAQERSRRRYFGRLVPAEGRLIWSSCARQIVDFVRACDYHPFESPWGRPTARLAGREVYVLRATRTHERTSAPAGTVGRLDEEAAWIASADEWVRVSRILVEGRSINAATRLQVGTRFEPELETTVPAAVRAVHDLDG